MLKAMTQKNLNNKKKINVLDLLLHATLSSYIFDCYWLIHLLSKFSSFLCTKALTRYFFFAMMHFKVFTRISRDNKFILRIDTYRRVGKNPNNV